MMFLFLFLFVGAVEHGLKITIQSNLKSVDYLDVTLNLTNGLFQPYRKPNDEPLYINMKSNHPPTVIKQIPAAIDRRLSALSSNKEKPIYDKALRSSGSNKSLHYCKKNTTAPTKRNRKRNIIWFNPPYSKNVQEAGSSNGGVKTCVAAARPYLCSVLANGQFVR